MEFYEVVEKRRTVRDFENETIPKEIIERIISAGFKAPTNDHMRDWHYIVIQDKDIVTNLLEIIPRITSSGMPVLRAISMANDEPG